MTSSSTIKASFTPTIHVRTPVDLIRRDQDRQRLRNLLLDGASSSAGPIAEPAYFGDLRIRLQSSD